MNEDIKMNHNEGKCPECNTRYCSDCGECPHCGKCKCGKIKTGKEKHEEPINYS